MNKKIKINKEGKQRMNTATEVCAYDKRKKCVCEEKTTKDN